MLHKELPIKNHKKDDLILGGNSLNTLNTMHTQASQIHDLISNDEINMDEYSFHKPPSSYGSKVNHKTLSPSRRMSKIMIPNAFSEIDNKKSSTNASKTKKNKKRVKTKSQSGIKCNMKNDNKLAKQKKNKIEN